MVYPSNTQEKISSHHSAALYTVPFRSVLAVNASHRSVPYVLFQHYLQNESKSQFNRDPPVQPISP